MLSVAIELSVFCLTVAAISSTEAETSSALAACSAAPCDSCCAVDDICSEPELTWSEAVRMSSTMRRRSLIMAAIALVILPMLSVLARYFSLTVLVRSPFDTDSRTPTISKMALLSDSISNPPEGFPSALMSTPQLARTGILEPLRFVAMVSATMVPFVRTQFFIVQSAVPQTGVWHSSAHVILPTTSSRL